MNLDLIELLVLSGCQTITNTRDNDVILIVHYVNVNSTKVISDLVLSFYPNAKVSDSPKEWAKGTYTMIYVLEGIGSDAPSPSSIINERNLIFITSHRQVEELKYFAKYLNKTKLLKDFDLILHVNSTGVNIERIRKYFLTLPNKNKHLVFTDKNQGYRLGLHEALSDFYDKISIYDNVIHIHSDVFIVNEVQLLNVIKENKNYGIIAGVGNMDPERKESIPELGTDLFFIRPKLIGKNIFKDYNDTELRYLTAERFLEAVVKNNNIPYTLVKKYENDWYLPRRPNLWGYYHEHDLKLLNV
jgi:hypothetical protein